jgi:hypothetical protein
MQLLDPELQLEKQTNEMKRKEAWRVYGALLVSFVALNQYRVHFRYICLLLTARSLLPVCCRQMLV